MDSFVKYLDNHILTKGQAFNNTSGFFYPIPMVYNGLYTYSSPFAQLVSDYSVTGAQMLSGVYVNGVFTVPGQNNLIDINVQRGQTYWSTPQTGTISANFAVKDFNIVLPAVPHIQMLFDTKLELRPKVCQYLTGLLNNELTFPAIFVRQYGMKETPYCIGGQAKTTTSIGCYIFANSQYLLDAVCSMILDLQYQFFPLLTADVLPFNSLGGYKNGILYNYTGLTQGYVSSGQSVLIEKVVITDFSRRIYSQIHNLTPNCYFSIAELEVFKDRVPQ